MSCEATQSNDRWLRCCMKQLIHLQLNNLNNFFHVPVGYARYVNSYTSSLLQDGFYSAKHIPKAVEAITTGNDVAVCPRNNHPWTSIWINCISMSEKSSSRYNRSPPHPCQKLFIKRLPSREVGNSLN